MTALGSKDLVFSSTQFSGSKSVDATQVNMVMCIERGDVRVVSSTCGGEKLTLVVDEAVGGEQFEGVDLEQDSVEQKVVSRRTDLRFVT